MPANWRILVVIRLSGYSATVFPGVASAELQGGIAQSMTVEGMRIGYDAGRYGCIRQIGSSQG